MRNQIVLVVAILALIATPTLAQQESGDFELQAQGTLRLVTSGDSESFGTVLFNYGRFFTQNQQIGGAIVGSFNEDGDLKLSGGPFYRYNIPRREGANMVPYTGASVKFGESYLSDDISIALEGGTRFFLNQSTAFSVGASTEYSIDEQEFADTIQVLFGLSYLWGR